MEKKERMVRHCPPTRFDYAVPGTIWECIIGKNRTDYYIQCSSNEIKPEWERMCFILEKAFEQFFKNDAFMEEVLSLYHHNNQKPLNKISDLIKV